MSRAILGVIIGNRGFFPDHLCVSGRKEALDVLGEEGIGAVVLSPGETRLGLVETGEDARKCADLFQKHRSEIDGVMVTLPNFGDERSIATALRLAGLDVPVLVHAFPDEPGRMSADLRRDSFCGKLSVCSNLRQYGIRFSLTRLHTVAPGSPAFREDLRWFASVCKVVRGLRNVRIGAIGARTAAFNTVRYSEKLLEASGITVEPIDLSEILRQASGLADDDPNVGRRLAAMKEHVPPPATVPLQALVRMAKLAAAIEGWVSEHGLAGTAIQCWTALEELYGVVPCAVMSMMSEALLPSACEVDVAGLVAMYALQLASGKPSALLDWNNNYRDDPDKAVMFHCGNLPRSLLAGATMGHQQIIEKTVGRDNTYGTIEGRIKSGPFTFARVSTDDSAGRIRAYVGEGEFADDPLETFGAFGVARIPNLQDLLRRLCSAGFEHHVAVNMSRTSGVLFEAFSNYLGWDVHIHPSLSG